MSDATLMRITCRVNASHALKVAGCVQMSSFSRGKKSPDSSPPQEVLPLWPSTSQEIVSWLCFLDWFFFILLISPAYTLFLFYSWCPLLSWDLAAMLSSARQFVFWAEHCTVMPKWHDFELWPDTPQPRAAGKAGLDVIPSTLQALQSGCGI